MNNDGQGILQMEDDGGISDVVPTGCSSSGMLSWLGRSGAGKTTAQEVIKDITAEATNVGLFSDTQFASLSTFSLDDLKGSRKFTLNIIDTPGLQEVRKQGQTARNDVEILQTVKFCAKNSIVQLHCLLLFVAFDGRFHPLDEDACQAYLQMFEHETIPIGLCISRCEGMGPELQDSIRKDLQSHSFFRTLLERNNVQLFFCGAVNSHRQSSVSSEKGLVNLYKDVHRRREKLLQFIFDCHDDGVMIQEFPRFKEVEPPPLEKSSLERSALEIIREKLKVDPPMPTMKFDEFLFALFQFTNEEYFMESESVIIAQDAHSAARLRSIISFPFHQTAYKFLRLPPGDDRVLEVKSSVLNYLHQYQEFYLTDLKEQKSISIVNWTCPGQKKARIVVYLTNGQLGSLSEATELLQQFIGFIVSVKYSIRLDQDKTEWFKSFFPAFPKENDLSVLCQSKPPQKKAPVRVSLRQKQQEPEKEDSLLILLVGLPEVVEEVLQYINSKDFLQSISYNLHLTDETMRRIMINSHAHLVQVSYDKQVLIFTGPTGHVQNVILSLSDILSGAPIQSVLVEPVHKLKALWINNDKFQDDRTNVNLTADFRTNRIFLSKGDEHSITRKKAEIEKASAQIVPLQSQICLAPSDLRFLVHTLHNFFGPVYHVSPIQEDGDNEGDKKRFKITVWSHEQLEEENKEKLTKVRWNSRRVPLSFPHCKVISNHLRLIPDSVKVRIYDNVQFPSINLFCFEDFLLETVEEQILGFIDDTCRSCPFHYTVYQFPLQLDEFRYLQQNKNWLKENLPNYLALTCSIEASPRPIARLQGRESSVNAAKAILCELQFNLKKYSFVWQAAFYQVSEDELKELKTASLLLGVVIFLEKLPQKHKASVYALTEENKIQISHKLESLLSNRGELFLWKKLDLEIFEDPYWKSRLHAVIHYADDVHYIAPPKGQKRAYFQGPIDKIQQVVQFLNELIEEMRQSKKVFQMQRPKDEVNLLFNEDHRLWIQKELKGIFIHLPKEQIISTQDTKLLLKAKINNVSIQVLYGSIIEERVDAIVSSANSHLDFSQGVAAVIQREAGPEFTEAIKAYREANECLVPTNVISTTGGNLLCDHVIHAVGPAKWYADQAIELKGILRKTISNILQKASELNSCSVSIPGIGSGYAQTPLDIVGNEMIEAIIEYFQQNLNSSIKFVRLIDKNVGLCHAWVNNQTLNPDAIQPPTSLLGSIRSTVVNMIWSPVLTPLPLEFNDTSEWGKSTIVFIGFNNPQMLKLRERYLDALYKTITIPLNEKLDAFFVESLRAQLISISPNLELVCSNSQVLIKVTVFKHEECQKVADNLVQKLSSSQK